MNFLTKLNLEILLTSFSYQIELKWPLYKTLLISDYRSKHREVSIDLSWLRLGTTEKNLIKLNYYSDLKTTNNNPEMCDPRSNSLDQNDFPRTS